MTNLTLRPEVAYMALAVCILTDLEPEEAFDRVSAPVTWAQKVARNRERTEDMIKLKEQGFGYKEIAEMYGVTRGTVWNRIKQYKKGRRAGYGRLTAAD